MVVLDKRSRACKNIFREFLSALVAKMQVVAPGQRGQAGSNTFRVGLMAPNFDFSFSSSMYTHVGIPCMARDPLPPLPLPLPFLVILTNWRHHLTSLHLSLSLAKLLF